MTEFERCLGSRKGVVDHRAGRRLTGIDAAETGVADERREIPPGANRGKADIETVDISPAAIFAGDVEAEPTIDVVADTKAEERRSIEAPVDVGYRIKAAIVFVEEAADLLIAKSDVAAQIPA